MGRGGQCLAGGGWARGRHWRQDGQHRVPAGCGGEGDGASERQRPCEQQAEPAGKSLGDRPASGSSTKAPQHHTQAAVPNKASLRSARPWGWTEDALGPFPQRWQVLSGLSVCSLSLVQVGCFLKTPRFPIWVVCSESHFSVLFSLQPELLRDWRTERLFDLYYYDGLAHQQEQIRLTIGAAGPRPIPRLPGEPPDRSGERPQHAQSGRPEDNAHSLGRQDWGFGGPVSGPSRGRGQRCALRSRWRSGHQARSRACIREAGIQCGFYSLGSGAPWEVLEQGCDRIRRAFRKNYSGS